MYYKFNDTVGLIDESNFIGGGAATEGNAEAPPPCTDGVDQIRQVIPPPMPWELWWLRNQPQPRAINPQLPPAPEEDGFPALPALGMTP
jgi:hypothetical protein